MSPSDQGSENPVASKGDDMDAPAAPVDPAITAPLPGYQVSTPSYDPAPPTPQPPSPPYQPSPPAYQPPPPAYQPPPPAYQPAAYQQPAPGPPPAAAGSAPAGGIKIRPIPLVGAVAVAVASALPWVSSVQGSASNNGFDVPFKFLFDPTGQSAGGFKVGLALVLLGVLGGLLTFVPATGVIRRLVGVAAIAIGGAFIGQLIRILPGGVSATKVIGFGVYVAIVGGVLLAAGK